MDTGKNQSDCTSGAEHGALPPGWNRPAPVPRWRFALGIPLLASILFVVLPESLGFLDPGSYASERGCSGCFYHLQP